MPHLASFLLVFGLATAGQAEEPGCTIVSATRQELLKQSVVSNGVMLRASLDMLERAVQSRKNSNDPAAGAFKELVERLTNLGREAERNEHRRAKDIRIIGRMAELALMQTTEASVPSFTEEDTLLRGKILALRILIPDPGPIDPPPAQTCSLETALDQEIQHQTALQASQPASDLRRLALLDATSRRRLEGLRQDYEAMKASPTAFGATWRRWEEEGQISPAEQSALRVLQELDDHISE